MKIWHLVSGCAALCLAGTAQAAVITQSFSFTGTNYTLVLGDGSVAPIDPATFSVTVTLDNTQTYNLETAGLTFASNLPYGAAFGYNPLSDTLVLATHAYASECTNLANSFCSFIQNFSTGPHVAFLQQSTSVGGYWRADSITMGVAVPEPETWAMLLLGFGTLGAAMRRRRRATLAYA